MSKRIIIIDNSNLSYSGEDINGTFLRGTETSLILLSENFIKHGLLVDFCNNINLDKHVNNVRYFNKNKIDKNILYDLAIAVSDAKQFDLVNAKKKVIFSVSIQSLEKFLRKRQLLSFLKHKPTVVTLCNYQYKKRSFLTSFYGKKIIPITVDPKFLNTNIDLNYIPEKKVFYNIRSNRNLDKLIKIWIEKIYPKDKTSKLFITPNLIDYNNDLKNKNIFLRRIGTRSELIDEIKNYRAMTYLGHKSDIFTLTVEESVRLCVPVVTYGIGSISDRVKHNFSGYIAKNEDEFANYTIQLLNNDDLYINFKNKMFQNRSENNWEKISNQWIKSFLND